MKIDYINYFKNKKITKQGFGFLGRGANVVKFLLENGADVLVTDMKTKDELMQSVNEVEEFLIKIKSENANNKNFQIGKVDYRLGEHRIEDFINCDYVIQASGVAKDNIYLSAAREAGKKVYQESSLFVEIVNDFNNKCSELNAEHLEYNAEYSKSDIEKNILKEENIISIIGVTGTRGKTTTTFLIKAIIESYLNKNYKNENHIKNFDKSNDCTSKLSIEKNEKRNVYFGGNVQGVATLENLKNVKGGDVIVMELDSWILQGFADIKFSPHIAVFTTFMPDHMNYYKGDMQEYFCDKANIFLYQKEGDIFITTEYIEKNIKEYLSQEQINIFYNSKSQKEIISAFDIKNFPENIFENNLIGDHNKINMSLAILACQKFGVNIETIKNSLKSFSGVKGRLELIREINHVKYFNDTTSTTPDALMAGLASLAPQFSINLICGGRDKELNITKAASMIINYKKENKIKNIILLSDKTTTGTEKLKIIFRENNFSDYIEFSSLSEAVKGAALRAAPGDIILFSPGFASFGMFANEYDRGEKYIEQINNMI